MATASVPSAASTPTQPIKRGRFVWYDLITTDVADATAFYTKVAGWGTEDFDMGAGGKYQMWTANGAPLGGVVSLAQMNAPEGTPPHWMSHVAVPDVDATVKQAESLGGKVLQPPTDIPTVGRYAVIVDPQGAIIAVFMSLHGGPVGDFAPKVGEFSWNELVTTDHKAAYAFYSKLFGWETISEYDMGPMGVYLMYGDGSAAPAANGQPPAYGGMMTKTPDMPLPPTWVYYVRVPSADAAAETVKSLGGRVVVGPMDVPGGDRIAQCLDPQGALFAVHSVKSA